MPKPSLTLFLFRVLENDGDGDPLDHGAVRASSIDALSPLLAERFEAHGCCGYGCPVTVRVYQLSDRADQGMLESSVAPVDLMVSVGPEPTNDEA